MTCMKSAHNPSNSAFRLPLLTSQPKLTVLQDVPHDPKLVKVSTSALASERLFELDHDRLNVVLVQ
jgi:hypothetical protein